jgi:hypothetical protein
MTRSAIPDILHAANWLVANHAHCTYSEGADRLSCVHKPFEVPFVSDCSAGVTDLFSWGGAPDPNDANFAGPSDTGTLLAHGDEISLHIARECDVVIFGPGDGWHAGLLVAGGGNPIVWSMGEQGDPRLYSLDVVEQAVAYVNGVTSCVTRWRRYDTTGVRYPARLTQAPSHPARRLRLPFLG